MRIKTLPSQTLGNQCFLFLSNFQRNFWLFKKGQRRRYAFRCMNFRGAFIAKCVDSGRPFTSVFLIPIEFPAHETCSCGFLSMMIACGKILVNLKLPLISQNLWNDTNKICENSNFFQFCLILPSICEEVK